jgi:hypothetical protein
MAEGAAVLRQKVAETASRLEESDQSVSSEGNHSWLLPGGWAYACPGKGPEGSASAIGTV